VFVIYKYSSFRYSRDFLVKGQRVERVVWLWHAKFVRLSKHSVVPERLRSTELHGCSTKDVTGQQTMSIKFLLLCQIFSLTLREERRLRMFENRVLRRIFGPKREDVTGEWRNLHNEELNDLYYSPNIFRVIKSRIMRWAGHVARVGDSRVLYRVLVGKPKGKRPLGRPRLRWEDNIIIDLQEVRKWDCGQDRAGSG